MSAGFRRLLAITGLAGAFSLSAAVAWAGPKDAEAEDLAKKSIYTDYLGTKFADAEKKLKQAIALCEPVGACSPKIQARLYCDLGVVYVGGMNRADDGKAQFVIALKLDSSIAPDPDLVSPEIEAVFKDAKSGGGSPKPTPPVGPVAPVQPVAPAAPSNGDLVHSPPPEQTTSTPLPLYAQLPPGTVAARVQLSYKPFGATEWRALEMRANGKGVGVEIPCVDVGSSQGELSYFIQAFDASQNLVSWSGTRAAPNKVAIRTALQGEAPHLPGQPPPARCAETGDCPPEFPGCHGAAQPPPVCDPANADCAQPDKPPARKNWLSLTIQQDWLVMPGSTQTCAGGTGYDCFDSSSNYYSGIPYPQSVTPNPPTNASTGDQVQGGIGTATTRILVGYDRVIVAGLTLGTRLGAAFRGGPQTPGLHPFLPFHGELRAAYWFGNDPFTRIGPRPYVILNGGVAEVDGSVGVVVYESQAAYTSDTRSNLTAWNKVGEGFIGGGAGVMFGVNPRHGPFLELKLMELLPVTGTSFSLAIGYAFGL